MNPLWLLLMFLLVAIVFVSTEELENENNKNEEVEEDDDEDEESISESELIKIATENHIHDPLNSFYDPFEPYRIITYAYWKPITNPALHKNPPIPPNFLPPNAPPKSLPTDFFFQDTAARQIVLDEHAAAFCPFLRRWREKYPLKPYPVVSGFSNTHPPIKFVPGKGYEIDTELDWLNLLSRRATDELARKYTIKTAAARAAAMAAAAKAAQTEFISGNGANIPAFPFPLPVSQSQPPEEPRKKEPRKVESSSKPKNKKPSTRSSDLEVLLSKIDEVKRKRPDCRKHENFISIPPPMNMKLSAPPPCLLEVIFLLEEHEDRTDPIGRESKLPEIVDKVEHYRQMLIKLDAMGESKGIKFRPGRKCPFGFKSGAKKRKAKAKSDDPPVKKVTKFYRGTIPQTAALKPGEEIFSTGNESESEFPTKYVFPYKLVPFPSIQDTLKRYFSI